MASRVTIKGANELRRKFNQLSKGMRGKVLENAVLAGGLLIQNAAVVKVPVRSGNLARSIHIGGQGGLANTTGTDVGSGEMTDTKVVKKIGTNVEYAPYVELGTSIQGAQPYLRPAFDENKNAAKQEIKDALKQQLDSLVR